MVKRFLCCLGIFLSCMGLTFAGKLAANATTEEIPPTEEEIIAEYESGYAISATSHFKDNNLYSLLLKDVREELKEKYDIDYIGDTLYSEMFKNFEEIIIDDNIITTLEGLQYIKFDNLKTLKITNNKITSISASTFENMPVIETVDFTSNEISSVDFGTVPTLKNIGLANNKLSSIDLEDLGAFTVNLNVAQNNISSMTDIKLPNRVTSVSLNIINNYISEIDDAYFASSKFKMSVGIQSLNSEDKINLDTSTTLRFYKLNIPGLTLKVFKFNGLVREETPYHVFSDANITEGEFYEEKKFEIGEYAFEYYLGDSPAYVKGDIDKCFYATKTEMEIIPTTTTAKFEYKGEVTDTFDKKVTGKVKVTLYSSDGGKIMYKVNNGDWQEGDVVMCDKGGNYTIYSKVVVGDVESKENIILVRTSQNVLIPDIVMLVLILLFTFGLFMIVVPYVSKKFFRK